MVTSFLKEAALRAALTSASEGQHKLLSKGCSIQTSPRVRAPPCTSPLLFLTVFVSFLLKSWQNPPSTHTRRPWPLPPSFSGLNDKSAIWPQLLLQRVYCTSSSWHLPSSFASLTNRGAFSISQSEAERKRSNFLNLALRSALWPPAAAEGFNNLIPYNPLKLGYIWLQK